MNSKLLILLWWSCVWSLGASGQAADIRDRIEAILEDLPEDADHSELTETLFYLSRHPIDLNSATAGDLKALFFLSDPQINEILEHRAASGPFLDLEELQTLDGFREDEVRQLAPFVRIGPEASLTAKGLAGANHEVLLTFGRVVQPQEGYAVETDGTRTYAGSPWAALVRYRLQVKDLVSVNLTMEKDAGEALFKGNAGFDFYSGSVFIKGKGVLREVAVGDYAIQTGQGLALWTGMGLGKSAAATRMIGSSFGLKPYRSANEAAFLRGAAMKVQWKKIDIIPFASYRHIDAGVNAAGELTAIRVSGLHRTAAERRYRKNVREITWGGAAAVNMGWFKAGFSAYTLVFGLPLAAKTEPYQIFDFTGRRANNWSAFYTGSFRNMYVFGELAVSGFGGTAGLQGALITFGKSISVLSVVRDYGKRYHSFFAQSIGESSNVSNERGWYSGITYTPNSRLELVAYADQFRFPWLRFGVDGPSRGYEHLAQVTWAPRKNLTLTGRFKEERKEESSDAPEGLCPLQEVLRRSFRFGIGMVPRKDLEVRTRYESLIVRRTPAVSRGSLFYHDILYSPVKAAFSCGFRVAFFF
jgi:hypothetical protein